jgi:preprotein translocase subunit SecE
LRTASKPHRPLNVKMRKFINYLKESYAEMTKKVSWPTWDKLQNSAIVVMVASVIFAIVIFAMDFCFQHLMSFIYTL